MSGFRSVCCLHSVKTMITYTLQCCKLLPYACTKLYDVFLKVDIHLLCDDDDDDDVYCAAICLWFWSN